MSTGTNLVGTPVKGQSITADQPGQYVKAGIAILGSAVVVVLLALSSGGAVTPLVVVNAILAAITVVPVWWFDQKWWSKAIAAGVLAALQLLVTLLSPTLGWGAVTDVNWASVILAFVTAAGVGIIPNRQMIDAGTVVAAEANVITSVPPAAPIPPTA